MAKVNVSEAASLVGVARSTLYSYIRSGKISTEKDAIGRPQIDTSELIRVFGDIKDNGEDNKNDTEIMHDVAESIKENATLRAENEALRELLRVRESQILEYQDRESWLRQRLESLETKLLPSPARSSWWSRMFREKG